MKVFQEYSFRKQIMNVTESAAKYELSNYFKSLSSDRFSKEYDLGKNWIIGPFEKDEKLTYTANTSWKDPFNIGWKYSAIHNCSLLPHDGKLFMFYRANPSMESLSSRIGRAVYNENSG